MSSPLSLGSSLPSVIQLSITPVILISGLGGLMITLTNRMARIVDRSRVLAGQIRSAAGEERTYLTAQLEVMWRRANLMRWSVTCVAVSMLTGCLLIGIIFLSALLGRELEFLMMAVFTVSLLFVFGSLALFLRDLFVSLVALGIEVKRTTGHD